MDPNAALESLRRLATNALRVAANEPHKDTSCLADEMAALFQGLDTWLAKGGFLPDAWRRGKIP